MDPHIDGVVPTPMSQDEKDFLSGNLRRIHAAYDDAGCDLSALPAKAADEIRRLREALEPFAAINLLECRLPPEFAMHVLRARGALTPNLALVIFGRTNPPRD